MLATEEMDGGGEGLVVARGEESVSRYSCSLANCNLLIFCIEYLILCSLTWCSTEIEVKKS